MNDNPIRVLIVEDDPLIAEAHDAYLERLGGFEVVARAGTAHEAMRRISGAMADAALEGKQGEQNAPAEEPAAEAAAE